MLKRVYIDNFRCFVNFELALDQQVLVLGLNGTGKSSFLDVLRGVRSVVSGDRKPDEIFPYSSRTRWQSLAQQTFELEVDLEEQYVFRLELEGWGDRRRPESRRKLYFATNGLCSNSWTVRFIFLTTNTSVE